MQRFRFVLFALWITPLFAAPAFAGDQDGLQFYAVASAALPTGDLSDLTNAGVGGGLGVNVPVGRQTFFRGEASCVYLLDDFEGEADVSLWQVPLEGFIQYDFTGSAAYVLAGLGVAWTSIDLGLDQLDGEDETTQTDLAFSPGIGFNLNRRTFLEARYNFIEEANSFSGHFGFVF